eukprot:955-Rhodomonas_salina.1
MPYSSGSDTGEMGVSKWGFQKAPTRPTTSDPLKEPEKEMVRPPPSTPPPSTLHLKVLDPRP